MWCFLWVFAFQQIGTNQAVYIREIVTYSFPTFEDEGQGGFQDTEVNEIWISKSRVRTDREENGQKLSMIFYPIHEVFYLVNHAERNYHIILTGRNRQLIRNPLFGLAPLDRDGKFDLSEPLALPTNQRMRIADWNCDEYQLDYPDKFGVTTTVWATKDATALDRSSLKRLWYSALGTARVPYDVRSVINQILRDIDGTPIRTVTTISKGDISITTVRTVVEISKRPTPEASFFDIPAGYDVATKDEL